MSSSIFLYSFEAEFAVDVVGVNAPRWPGFKRPPAPSWGISENLRPCDMEPMPAPTLPAPDALKSPRYRQFELVAFESSENELDIIWLLSVSFGGVISTLTSVTSPAMDDDWLNDWLILLIHGVLAVVPVEVDSVARGGSLNASKLWKRNIVS